MWPGVIWDLKSPVANSTRLMCPRQREDFVVHLKTTFENLEVCNLCNLTSFDSSSYEVMKLAL